MSDDGDSFHLDDNDDAEPITAEKVYIFFFLSFKDPSIEFYLFTHPKNSFQLADLGIGKFTKHMVK